MRGDPEEALTNQSKVVKVIVDIWFVDGVRLRQNPDRAERLHPRQRSAEKDKGRANKVAQRVRRAAALTAELAVQSKKKSAGVCDQPPGLDELAKHIEALNMRAGGLHPQATMMPDPWAKTNVPLRAATRPKPVLPPRQIASLQTEEVLLPPECSAVLDFDQPNLTSGELQQGKRAEQEQRLCRKREEAWELYQRQPTLMRKSRENFETKFREKVLGGICSSSKDEQEKDLQLWMNELEKVAWDEERRLEAFEKKTMGGEDAQSRRRQAWGQDLPVSPEPVPHGPGHRPTRMVRTTGERELTRERKRERTLKGLGKTSTTLRPTVEGETERRLVMEVYTSFGVCVYKRSPSDFWWCDVDVHVLSYACL